MFEHGVEDDEQFAHTRDHGHLLRFTMRQQPLVEVADGGVVAGCGQRPHVEGAPHSGAPPQTARLPRRVPLSRLKGATPTRAATCLWSNVPNSGR